MDIAGFAIRNRVTTLVVTFLLLGGGLSVYQKLSRLEDPEFTIKDALVITPYPGASAKVVAEELEKGSHDILARIGRSATRTNSWGA